jgi:hypothetical protein
MIRREFITLVGGAASAWPLAQQFQTLPTIGFLGASTSLNWAHRTTAFVRRLGEDQLGLLLAVKNPTTVGIARGYITGE